MSPRRRRHNTTTASCNENAISRGGLNQCCKFFDVLLPSFGNSLLRHGSRSRSYISGENVSCFVNDYIIYNHY